MKKDKFFLNPYLQVPKGTVLEEVGTMLARGAWELDNKGNKVPKVGKNGQTLKTKSGKVIYKRTPYKIKVFNTINFAKSMHYNPFAYIHTEQDVLKFVNTLIANTKGEGAQSGEDFWVKAERLLFTAYVAYIVKYCKKSERNFVSLLAMIDASETREEDEDFENAIDLMFKDIEFGNDEEGIEADPDSFAVRQYHKYKLAAGVVSLKRLLNQSNLKSWSSKMIKKSLEAYFFTLKNKIVFCKKQFQNMSVFCFVSTEIV